MLHAIYTATIEPTPQGRTSTTVLLRYNCILTAGVDKHNNLIGRLMYVGKDEQLIDMGGELVDAGLAKVINMTVSCRL